MAGKFASQLAVEANVRGPPEPQHCNEDDQRIVAEATTRSIDNRGDIECPPA
jgi:hypothetical protein